MPFSPGATSILLRYASHNLVGQDKGSEGTRHHRVRLLLALRDSAPHLDESTFGGLLGAERSYNDSTAGSHRNNIKLASTEKLRPRRNRGASRASARRATLQRKTSKQHNPPSNKCCLRSRSVVSLLKPGGAPQFVLACERNGTKMTPRLHVKTRATCGEVSFAKL